MLRKLESQPHVLSGRIAESSKLASGKIIRKSLSTGKASELAVESWVNHELLQMRQGEGVSSRQGV